jgi:hypothetical protein
LAEHAFQLSCLRTTTGHMLSKMPLLLHFQIVKQLPPGHKLPGPPIANRIRRLANGQRPTRQNCPSWKRLPYQPLATRGGGPPMSSLQGEAPSVETRNITACLGRVNSRVRGDSTLIRAADKAQNPKEKNWLQVLGWLARPRPGPDSGKE